MNSRAPVPQSLCHGRLMECLLVGIFFFSLAQIQGFGNYIGMYICSKLGSPSIDGSMAKKAI